jgi:hypothetical protein
MIKRGVKVETLEFMEVILEIIYEKLVVQSWMEAKP